MANELTYLSVIDTAVKIGLGALITAISGYLILRQTQKGQIKTEYREEKRKYIGELLEAIGYASGRALDFWSYINDRQINIARGVSIPEDVEKKLNESNRIFHASFEKITLLEGKYYVVAGESKYRELVEYIQFLAQFHWHGSVGTVDNLKTWPAREKQKREKLLESISDVYAQDRNA